METWKDVKDYEGLYQVSNKGRVRSLTMWDGHKYKKRKQPLILRQTFTTTGYKKVELIKNKEKKSFKVHRLVGFAFIPTIRGKTQINHIDGNPINNNVENLEWCNQSENIQHAYKTGLIPKKITLEDEKQIIKKYYENEMTTTQIAKKHGIEKSTIYRILKKHGKKPQGIKIRNNKYNINKQELIKDFKNNEENKFIAKKHGCPTSLIATLKCNYKKEGVI